jgi:hypothetical protein
MSEPWHFDLLNHRGLFGARQRTLACQTTGVLRRPSGFGKIIALWNPLFEVLHVYLRRYIEIISRAWFLRCLRKLQIRKKTNVKFIWKREKKRKKKRTSLINSTGGNWKIYSPVTGNGDSRQIAEKLLVRLKKQTNIHWNTIIWEIIISKSQYKQLQEYK